MVADDPGITDMPQLASADPSPILLEDRAVLLFAQMDVAQARGEYARAAEAQRELEALGWIVSRKRPPRRPATRQPDAARPEEVAR
jgi:hypothetical protein